MKPANSRINPHALALRRNATDAERKLWAALRNRQLDGHKFRRQATIKPYIVDFLCIEAKLIIEVDGGQHDAVTDAGRTAFLEGIGFSMVRLWNHEVLGNLEGCLEHIRSVLACR